uniref:Uncharacterized protein n=1 Tax=Globisporangium ultimum (strain ATCC 200006 / CBS 805.95 / DAOM BR144) TaxID=431595 RepID=K3WJS5_GLOUD
MRLETSFYRFLYRSDKLPTMKRSGIKRHWPRTRQLQSEMSTAHAGSLAVGNKRRKQPCGCTSGETCHACFKCLEQHCMCGDPRRHRGMCLESRACNCVLANPQDRRQRIEYAQVTVKQESETTSSDHRSEQEWKRCRCYELAAAPNMSHEMAMKERNNRYKRIQRLRQRTGVPSVENIYRKTIATTLDSAAGEGDDNDHYHIDGGVLARSPFEDSVYAIVHRPLAKTFLSERMLNVEPPYASLHRGDAVSYQESIEPRTRFLRQTAILAQALVDYVVHASSVKAAHAGEMVGTFDDSAAVAAAIVMEEYMRQLVEDTLMENRPTLQVLTKENVQEFAMMMLSGFNWATTINGSDENWDELVAAIYEEVLCIQEGSGALEKDDLEIKAWIRDTGALKQMKTMQ